MTPSTLTVLLTLARLTWRRLRRGRAVWVSSLLAFSPVAFAIAIGSRVSDDGSGRGLFAVGGDVFVIEQLVLAVLPAMFIAASIGEEIEDRTTTYLWSRPIARWTVLAGKLLALAPIAIALVVGGWFVALQAGLHHLPTLRSAVGLGAGTLVVSMAAAGIATLVPKHGMALAIVYVLFFDLPVGEIPASLQLLSVTRQAKLLAGMTSAGDSVGMLEPALALAIVGGVWLAIGVWRMQRLES